MQVSPSGMAAASQAASGEFDSRHLLQLKKTPDFFGCFLLAIFSLRQCRRKSLDFPLPAPNLSLKCGGFFYALIISLPLFLCTNSLPVP